MPIQIYKRTRTNPYADAITGLTEGFLRGQELRQNKRKMQMAEEESTIANALNQANLARAQRDAESFDPDYERTKRSQELEKGRRENELLAQPLAIPVNPYTGKPEGFLFGGKFQQFKQPATSRLRESAQDFKNRAMIESGREMAKGEAIDADPAIREAMARQYGYRKSVSLIPPAKPKNWWGRPNKPTEQIDYSLDEESDDSEISEEDIQFTMEKYGVSREEVLERLGI